MSMACYYGVANDMNRAAFMRRGTKSLHTQKTVMQQQNPQQNVQNSHSYNFTGPPIPTGNVVSNGVPAANTDKVLLKSLIRESGILRAEMIIPGTMSTATIALIDLDEEMQDQLSSLLESFSDLVEEKFRRDIETKMG